MKTVKRKAKKKKKDPQVTRTGEKRKKDKTSVMIPREKRKT